MNKPILRCIATLWTLTGHPAKTREWLLDKKLCAIKAAGFDGVCGSGSAELRAGCEKHGLIFIGAMASSKPTEFSRLLRDLKKSGAHHINVQLASDAVPTPQALRLTRAVWQEGRRLGLEPAVETHRGTCTETPEKLYALADAFQNYTGELLPVAWDFSHFAVVKQLAPENFIERLLVRPELVQRAQQFHFRPFNGHHIQVPITDDRGNLSPEVKAWLPFAGAVLRCWLAGNKNSAREIFICPELGPVASGYALSLAPDSWEQAKVLRGEIDRLWRKILAETKS